MRIHRSAHQRFFTTLGNDVLRDSRLSFCARGILAHLLSQPDGKRDNIRTLTERTPEGRERVASAMRELEKFGYIKRTKKRTPEGQLYTEVEVFEAPMGPLSRDSPSTDHPASGGSSSSSDGDHPVKERDQETALPASMPTPLPAPSEPDAEGGRADDGEEDSTASVALLTRIARAEPKLSLGRREALRLAPLVSEWRRRGASDLHVINSLTAGLPRGGVHHPARFIESRLISKMPAERRAPVPKPECGECGVPVLTPGLCRSCTAAEAVEDRSAADFGQVRARGIAMARAALRGLTFDSAAPALS